MLHQTSLAVAIAILLCSAAACSKKEVAPASRTVPSDMVTHQNTATTLPVLAKTFTLKSSETFPFEIPAHSSQPHLHGIFQTFAGQAHGPSDDSANVDFVILNEEQRSEADADRPSEALFSVEASHNQSVNFDLPPSINQPVKYYLVFRNAQGSKSNKVVEANFRVDF
jgi:hypothetical protein